MRKFSKIKKFFLLFNIKILILITLTSFTLLIAYFYYFKYKNLIFEQLTISKNRIFYGSEENIKPKLIILGNKYINSKSLIHELDTNLNLAKNKNDLSLISNILKKKKLIKKFIITKTSENLLTIKIEEKNIIGLTKIKNSHYLIDEFNNLIEQKITPKLFHLPFFYGKNSYKNANVILRLVKKSDVSINYTSFSFIDDRRWNINLNNGVTILLPETNIIDTLKLLKKIDSEHNILKGNFIEIDLRIYKKFFLKPKIN